MNGNLTAQTVNGQTRTFTWDDEDRLTGTSSPRYSDAFSYTGLGLRLTKTDSTGGYAYLCDGVSPDLHPNPL